VCIGFEKLILQYGSSGKGFSAIRKMPERRGRGRIDPEGFPAQTLEESGKIEIPVTGGETESVYDLRGGGITDGYLVQSRDLPVVIYVSVFDITAHIGTEILPGHTQRSEERRVGRGCGFG